MGYPAGWHPRGIPIVSENLASTTGTNEEPPIEEIHAGLVVAIEFRLSCGHTICQAIRQEKMVHRTEVYEAMKEAGDKLSFWLTRHGIPKHKCDQVSDFNPNGEDRGLH